MREIARAAVEAALNAGASYADARVVRQDHESVQVKNGHVEGVARGEDLGIGIRVIADGAWGFAASADLTADSVADTAREAVRIARASARAQAEPITLSDVPPVAAEWSSTCKRDPFAVPLDDKISLLMDMDGLMRATRDVRVAEGQLNSFRTEKFFANSEGSDIHQTTTECGGLLQATAVGNGEVQTRSYPSALEGYHGQAGWEGHRRAQCRQGSG